MRSDDFGTLCICAIRYCQGRETYMPDLVRGIVKSHIDSISDATLDVMLNDCEFQRTMNLYGDERIDKPGWIEWEDFLKNEVDRRRQNL